MVFGIVGCAVSTTSFTMRDGIRIYNPLSPSYSSDVESYYKSLETPKAKAMPIRVNGLIYTSSGGYQYHIIDGGDKYSSQDEVNTVVLNKCEELYFQKCLIVYEGNKDVWSQNQTAYQNTPEVQELFKELREKKLAREKLKQQRIENQKIRTAQLEAERKKSILNGLTQRCEKYGFTGESNISACIQREAQHDKELAMQRLELQRTYAQNINQPVEEEEDIPFLIKFLGDVVIGVAEQYPAAKLEAQKRQEAYNRGVRRGQEAQRIRCNNQQGNC